MLVTILTSVIAILGVVIAAMYGELKEVKKQATSIEVDLLVKDSNRRTKLRRFLARKIESSKGSIKEYQEVYDFVLEQQRRVVCKGKH